MENRKLSWPQVLGQFKQPFRLEFSTQDFVECAHCYNYDEFVTSDGTEITGVGLECLSGVASCTTLFADTVHPSNAGYKIWWDNLKPILDKLIKK